MMWTLEEAAYILYIEEESRLFLHYCPSEIYEYYWHIFPLTALRILWSNIVPMIKSHIQPTLEGYYHIAHVVLSFQRVSPDPPYTHLTWAPSQLLPPPQPVRIPSTSREWRAHDMVTYIVWYPLLIRSGLRLLNQIRNSASILAESDFSEASNNSEIYQHHV